MNPYLEKLNFQQLLELFLTVTKEFITALETERPFKELKNLREQVRSISEMIELKKLRLKKI
jgi:hypothetical protein